MMSNIKRILCFGDSLTEGWIQGGKRFHPYTIQLKSLLDEEMQSKCEVINEGLSGEMVHGEMNKRLPLVLEKHPEIDLLVIQGGTNDILLNKNLKEKVDLFEEFKKLVDISKTYNVPKVCVLTIMQGYYTDADDAVMTHTESNQIRVNCNEKIRSYAVQNQNLIMLCDIEWRLPCFDLNENEKKTMWDDCIHPSIAGYEQMGRVIFDHIKNIL